MNCIRLRPAAQAGMFLFLAFCLGGIAVPASAQGNAAAVQAAVDFNIPAQNLDDALTTFAQQSGQELLYSPATAAGITGNTVEGRMTRSEAMGVLLEGTGLEYELHPSGSMLIGDEAALQTYRQQLDSPDASVAGQNTIGQRRPGIEEIIVTGQKREERIQDVPIAISAFSPEDLEAQKIEGGFDLLKGVPNVTFSKTNFTGYNFQIRGIGTQAISATTDPGVAVSMNNTTLIVNRLFEQEYLDVERVEVLRGPQGTLFGRNATGGVINVITKKPEMGVWDGMIDVEVGNYNARRLRGFFNAPIGDTLAIRGAYASTQRDGFGINEAADNPRADVSRDVDNRDLWTGRLTLGWQPTDRFRLDFIWERFEEDDNRVRTSKQLCHRDAGPENNEIFGQSFPDVDFENVFRAGVSQGCKAGSLYADEAFGTPNGSSLPYISGPFFAALYGGLFGEGGPPSGDPDRLTQANKGLGPSPYIGSRGTPEEQARAAECPILTLTDVFYMLNPCQSDPYAGRMQSRDLRTIDSLIQPQYRASADIFDLSFDLELTDSLVLSSQTVYAEDEYYATQDYNRFTTVPIFEDSSRACNEMVVAGKTEVDCSDDPDTGRGTWMPLKDADRDGLDDHTGRPLNVQGETTVDAQGYVRDQDGRRVSFYNLTPDGVYCDPQLGCSDTMVLQDLSQSRSRQFNQEVRLVSSFDGPVNFSVGANYTNFDTHNDYYVFSNMFSLLLNVWPFNHHGMQCDYSDGLPSQFCRYTDPNPLEDINGEGHNYFRSANPYELSSAAVFGELYTQVTDTLKLTVGARFTWDEKVFTPIPSQLLLADYRAKSGQEGAPPPAGENCVQSTCPFAGNALGGRGSPASPPIVQEWREPTGRIVLDWQPHLGLDWVDESMFYASLARGYKGGGANPPSVAPPAGSVLAFSSGGAAPPTFEPEYVNAFELGTKNTLFGGAATLNLTGFYYDYSDYQVSKIVDRSAANENFDAEVWGMELEALFAPTLDWQFNAAIGYLDTRVAEGEKSIDLMDRTDGGNRHYAPDPDAVGVKTGETTHFPEGFDEWVVMKPWVAAASNCVVPANLVAANLDGLVNSSSGHFVDAYCAIGNVAGGGPHQSGTTYYDEAGNRISGSDDSLYDATIDAPNGGAGFFKDLSGNELPNAPNWTVSLGGQYGFDLSADWRATARIDYYWQADSYARIYNYEPYDRLQSWSNTNLSFWVNNPVNGITVEAYVKNVFDETPITGSFLNSDDSGLTTNVFTLDPRLIGVSLRKEF